MVGTTQSTVRHSNGGIQIARIAHLPQAYGPNRLVFARRMILAESMKMRFGEKIVGSLDKVLQVKIQ